jgi:WD40 repeat protein
VAARPWEHADRAQAALRAIMDDPGLGVAVLSNGRLAANVLEDLLPDAPRERAILVLAAQAGIAQALLDHAGQGLDRATASSLAVVLLEANSPLDPDSCEWVVAQIAAAIGLARAAEPDRHEPTRLSPVPVASAEPLQAAATVTAGPAPPVTPVPIQQPKRRKRRRTAVNCAAFSADGRLLATGADDGSASVWDAGTGALRHRLAGHNGQVRAVVFSPGGKFLATAAAGDVARLWNVASGTLERDVTLGPAWHVAFSPDGQLLATAGGGTSQPAGVAAPAATEIAARFWLVATGALAGRTAGSFLGHATAVAFSADGKLLATAGPGGAARLWSVATGIGIRSLPVSCDAVAFSPDGRLLATAGADDVARLWEVATGRPVRAATAGPARDVAFSPDGALLATAGGGRARATGVAAASVADNSAWLWQVSAGTLVRELAGHAGQVQTVAFSPDGGLLTSTARDRTTRVWNLRSADLSSRLVGD